MSHGGRRAGAGRKPGSTSVYTSAPLQTAIRQADSEIPPEAVIWQWAAIARSDIGNLFDEQQRLLPLHGLDPKVRAAISSIKVTRYNKPGQKDGVQEDVVEIKLWDKVRVLELAAKHHGLLVEKVRVEGTVTLLEKVNRARARLKHVAG